MIGGTILWLLLALTLFIALPSAFVQLRNHARQPDQSDPKRRRSWPHFEQQDCGSYLWSVVADMCRCGIEIGE